MLARTLPESAKMGTFLAVFACTSPAFLALPTDDQDGTGVCLLANILILEDDPEFGKLLVASLRTAGHTCRLCVNGTEAVALFKEEPAEVFIADVIVKVGGVAIADGGILATSRIRRLAKDMLVPLSVIAISGVRRDPSMGAMDMLKMMNGVGADALLAKPFPPNLMLQKIDELLAEQKRVLDND